MEQSKNKTQTKDELTEFEKKILYAVNDSFEKL